MPAVIPLMAAAVSQTSRYLKSILRCAMEMHVLATAAMGMVMPITGRMSSSSGASKKPDKKELLKKILTLATLMAKELKRASK